MFKIKWNFQHYSRVKIVFTAAILMVLILALGTIRGHNQLEQYIASLEKTDYLIQQVHIIKKIVSDSQLSLRGYLSSNDRQFLITFKESTDSVGQNLGLLTKFVVPHSAQGRKLQTLNSLINAEFQFGLQIITLKNNNQTDEALKKLNLPLNQSRSAEIKRLLFELEREESNNQQMKLMLLDQSSSQQRNLQYLGFACGLVLLALSWVFVMMTLKQKDRIETELNRFFASSPDLFCIADLDTIIKRSNSSYSYLLGYSGIEMLNKSFLDFVHSDDRENILYQLRNLKSNLLPTTAFECRCIKKDNSFVWFSWKLTLVAETSSFYGVGRDITDRKQLEVENMVARQAAMAANEAKSHFLANVSHEIRTPLHGVMGMTKLLLDTPLATEQLDHAENILFSSQNLLAVINDVLDLSKIEAGQMSIEIIDFDMNELISSVQKNVHSLAEQKNIHVSIKAPEMPFQIKGDVHRIRQVLTNLMSNGIKFTEKGQVSLTIESLAEPESDYAFRFSVVDTGIGLSEKAIKKLFKAFSQADSSTSRKYGGTGLGLSICKQLVELMGGQIGVTSIEGQGSTFWFELGFEKSSLATVKKHYNFNKKNINYSGRVLVADDNIINQKVIAKTLQKLGLVVDVVENGLEVIKLLESKAEYDIIFLDGHMPHMDGYATAKTIRSSMTSTYQDVVLVALTANALKGERERCLQLGMNDFLVKPIEDDKLFEVLSRFLNKSENLIEKSTSLEIPKLSASKEILDLTYLHKLEALQDDGEPDIVIELIESFLKDSTPRLNLLSEYLNKKDFQKVIDEAHSLKSSSRMVGLISLGHLLEKIESYRNEPDFDQLQSLVLKVVPEFVLGEAELKLVIQIRQQKNAA